MNSFGHPLGEILPIWADWRVWLTEIASTPPQSAPDESEPRLQKPAAATA